MINQDEVFVITEDDILKPPDKGRKGGSARGLAVSKSSRTSDETVVDRPTPRPASRVRRAGNPAAASSLSLLFWGLGQAYNGDTRLAALFALSEVLIVSFHYLLYRTWGDIRTFAHTFFVSEWEMMLYASSLDFCVIFFMIYNVAQAYRAAEPRAGSFGGLKRPLVSGLASMLVPGWGQLLNGQLGKATFFLFSFLMQVYLLGIFLLSPFYRIVAELEPRQMLLNNAIRAGMGVLFATALSWMLAVYDAVLVARYSRRS
jgi:hypothetical protein